MRRRRLTKEFFNRPADVVARELLGCLLCVKTEEGTTRHRLTETEAYMGPHDLASHASRGRTTRTETMYREAGVLYIYFIYGMYDMLNIVTGEKEYPAAVLIRGAGDHTGPGKLTKSLGITRALNGLPLGVRTGVWIESRESPVRSKDVIRTPRIGVGYAKHWAKKPLRFVLKNENLSQK